MYRATPILLLSLGLTLAAACSDDKPSTPGPGGDVIDAAVSPEPEAVLRDLGEIVIVPTLEQLHQRAGELVVASRALCEAPGSAGLDSARAAWRAARAPWKQSEAFRFGPVIDLRVDSAVDFWPLRLSSVQAELAKDTPVPEDYASTLGDTVKGLPVIEYLLFDGGDVGADATQEDIDAAVLARLASSEDGAEPTATRTCDYLVALSVDVELRAKLLRDAWSPDGDNFVDALASSGEAGGAYDDRGKAISAIVNAFVQLIQEVEGTKLATPLGLRDGGTPQPEAAESWRSGNSRQDILDNLAGIQSVYQTRYGDTTGASFERAVAAIDPALDSAIRAQLSAAIAAVEAIEGPLDEAVVDAPAAVDAAFQANKELLRYMAVDMVNVLGVTLSFSDNDGD
ncbi:MAG: imelysin family protein [Haliangiales bacterium]